MFPVGVVIFSLGYAVWYYGATVLRWVHDPAHPHVGPPSFAFLLGLSATPTSGKPFSAPVNVEGAADAFTPFGAGGSTGGPPPPAGSAPG